jgi:hypothetical protein
MIADDLDIFGTPVGPSEHDPPLIIDADRVLAGQIALEGFKVVAGRRSQDIEKVGGVHHDKLSARDLCEVRWKPLRDCPVPKDRFGELSLEALDHGYTYLVGIRISRPLYLGEIPKVISHELAGMTVTVHSIRWIVECTEP